MSTKSPVMPYQLVALAAAARPSPDAPRSWRHLGQFPDLNSALHARVDDVLAQLTANDGWLVQVEHLLIGPGPAGPATVSSCVSSVGADPHSDLVPAPFDLDATRSWLIAGHGLR